jgi:hypothetical protein
LTDNQQNKKNARDYVRYSGMAMELFGLLLILMLAGRYLDNRMGNPKQYVTAFLVTVGLIAYLYKLYLELTKARKQ